MKTCPYAITGLLSQSGFVASVLDGCTPVKDYSTLVACREEDCGRYALCKGNDLQNTDLSITIKKVVLAQGWNSELKEEKSTLEEENSELEEADA